MKYRILKYIDTKKTVGFDVIPPKSVKITTHILYNPLSRAINNSLLQGVFPETLKFL